MTEKRMHDERMPDERMDDERMDDDGTGRQGMVVRCLVVLCLVLLLAGCAAAVLQPVAGRTARVAPVGARQLGMEPWQSRTFHGRRLEPAGDVLLHGAGQTDRSSFDRYTAAVLPRAPMLFMTYVDLRDDLPAFFTRLQEDLDHFDTRSGAGAAVLTVPQIGLSLNRGSASLHYEAETAAGADDDAIGQMCRGVLSLHRPVYVRVGYEFNGFWNGYSATAYVAAFRRVAAALHTCGGADVAVVWDWSADAEVDAEAGGRSGETLPARLAEWYPGDDAVDWWGVNLFSPEGIVADATRQFLDAAERSGHPVMVAESTPKGFRTTDAAVRDVWFVPYFGLLRASPGIRAFCYIDWDWRGYPQWAEWGDGRIEAAAPLLEWYRDQLRMPGVRGAAGRADTVHLLRAGR